MNILMLNPPYIKDFCRSARWTAKSRGRVQRHPDWMLIAAAVLEKAGHNIKFVDGAAQNLDRQDIKDILVNFRPELVVCHTTTPTIYNDISYCRLSKEACNSMTVLIGPHVTVLPEDTFKNAVNCVDIIIRGEYDYVLRDIANGADKADIKGISYLDDGNIINNPERELLDVNELPFPAWHHIKPQWYRDAGKLYPFLTLISARGCFGRCTFCRDTPVMYGRQLRLRDAEIVIDEIEYDLKLFPQIKEIMFETDTFSAVTEHVQNICEEILKRRLKIKWSCNVRVDMDLKLLPLMKRAGARMLMVGFEFGTQHALDAVKKGVTLEQSKRFSETAHRLGFIQHGCFMVGAPGETEDMVRKTIKFATSLPLDTVQFSGICAYPGTELYEWAKQNGFLIAKDWPEWVDGNGEQITLLDYPQLKKQRIDALIDEGLKRFYLRPTQVFKMAFNIKGSADLKRKIYGLRSFIDYFLNSKRNKNDRCSSDRTATNK